MNPNDKISHIEPKKKWLDVDLRGLWRYRDLYYMYIKRDIVTQYKQTILGPLWYIIQPLLTTIMYMFVFGGLAGISTDGIPQPLFYMAGITMWNYFSTCFTSCSEVFSHNANVFGKVYFPRLVVPLSSCTSNLIRMLIQLLMFIAIYIYYIATGQFAATLSFSVMLFPLFILMTGLHAMSWGLLFILELNPLTPIFEAFKYSCLGTGTFSFIGLIYSLIFLCVTMFFSVIIFNRTEQRFMDTV